MTASIKQLPDASPFDVARKNPEAGASGTHEFMCTHSNGTLIFAPVTASKPLVQRIGTVGRYEADAFGSAEVSTIACSRRRSTSQANCKGGIAVSACHSSIASIRPE